MQLCIKIKNQYFLNMIKPIGNIYDYFNYSYSKALKLRQGLESFNDRYKNKMIYWLPISTIDYAYKLIKKRNYQSASSSSFLISFFIFFSLDSSLIDPSTSTLLGVHKNIPVPSFCNPPLIAYKVPLKKSTILFA